ncbi:MAG: stage III sporulation protein AF [Clostridia bacterium]|nr:stage III sporulation protein AF [Clostridia bacterium]
MKDWLLGVFSVALIITLLSLILPEGKTAKFVKPFISLIAVVIIVSPLINADALFSGNVDFYGYKTVETDSDFIEYAIYTKIDKYRLNCVKIAEKNGITGSGILIKYNVDENYGLTVLGAEINLTDAVISSEDEHIVILQRLVNEISAYLNVDKAGIKIYE